MRKKKRRFDYNFHKFVQKVTTSSLFNGSIMFVIVGNALCIGLETVDDYKDVYENTFKTLDEFFLSVYTMEFFMKLYAEPRAYWKSSYNIFDFSILGMSYIQVLVIALIDTIRHSVVNVVILLTMLMGFFAVVGYYIFGYEADTGDKKNWGNLSTAMLTLFTFVTRSSQYANFEEMTRSFQQTLRHDDYVIMADPCTNPTWIETFLATTDHLDLYTFRSQQLHFQIANVLADMADKKWSSMYGI
ncbi:predicted protein, partial [Nematostella vectensis]